MKVRPAPWAVVLLWFSVSAVIADPENFMINDFTFVRPPEWKWIPTPKGEQARLQITGADTNQIAVVNFYRFEPKNPYASAANTASRWKGMFQDDAERNYKTRNQTIAGRKMTYVEIAGTLKSKGEKAGAVVPQPNHALMGAILVDSKGNILIRLVGSKAVVEKSTAQFKKMIEDALKGNE